jgi:GNAT superfamily N-acetyltransferase
MRLIEELAAYERAQPSDLSNSAEALARDGWPNDGNAPKFNVIVAEMPSSMFDSEHDVDKIVGFALYFAHYSTWRGACTYLEDLYVSPQHRGVGVGMMLFRECVLHASRLGHQRVMWQALDWNVRAHKFYRDLGAAKCSEWVPFRLTAEGMRSFLQQHNDDTDIRSDLQ